MGEHIGPIIILDEPSSYLKVVQIFIFYSNEHLNLCEEIREKDVILSRELTVIKI